VRNMTRFTRAVALAAVAALFLAAGTAAANQLEISNSSIRATFNPLRFIAGTSEVACPVTLEGTFHSRVIRKNPEALIGYITRADINGMFCSFVGADELTILGAGRPWHIRYESFTGRLPNIDAVNVRLLLVGVRGTFLNLPCLYRSTATRPGRAFFDINPNLQVETLDINSEAQIPLTEGSLFCPATASLAGSGRVRLLGSSTVLIFIRLI
jgi:hypothetical protein